MTANNVLHSCSPGTKCAIKIAAPAFEPRLEAAKVDLGEKHEPRGDGERAGKKWRLVDEQTAIREGRYLMRGLQKQGQGTPTALIVGATRETGSVTGLFVGSLDVLRPDGRHAEHALSRSVSRLPDLGARLHSGASRAPGPHAHNASVQGFWSSCAPFHQVKSPTPLPRMREPRTRCLCQHHPGREFAPTRFNIFVSPNSSIT
jgi:hypothetical protein